MATDPIDLDRLESYTSSTAKVRTHTDDCYLWPDHKDCAVRRLIAELRAARAELAAVDDAIADRGVPERDCTLPVAERVDNIIVELKQWRHEAGKEMQENDRLRTRLATLEPLVAAIVKAATTAPAGFDDDGRLWQGAALDDAVEALVLAERGTP